MSAAAAAAAAAAAHAIVRSRCLFGGATACSSAIDPSRLKLSCGWGWGWGRRYLSQSLPNPDLDPRNKILPKIQIQKQKQKVPWLMLSSTTRPESRYFYDLLTRGAGGGQLQAQDGDDGMPLISLNREIDLPQIAGHRCVGSSQGFLITVDRNAEIHATNPITGARLPLPSTATLPNMIGVVRDPTTGDIKYYISSKDTTDSPEIIELINEENGGRNSLLLSLNHGTIDSHNMGYMREAYYRKLILSPSLDTAVAYHLSSKVYGSGRLAFARLGGDGTSSSWSWTRLPSDEDHRDLVNDIILHKGRLHAIDYAGTLSVYDMENPSAQPFRSPEGPLFGVDGSLRTSVVESADGDDLFLVFRYLGNDGIRTQGFMVFKLDKSDYKWNQVDSTGDLAFFVGFHHNISLSAHGFHGLKPNSIYFMDEDHRDLDGPQLVGDTGVFNMKDGSIQFIQFFQLADGLQELNWPPPVWFMPAMR